MSYFKPIDIKTYFNHRIVYSGLPEVKDGEEFGLDNICILKPDLKLKKNEKADGVDFLFLFGENDNIICNGQKIEINETATKLHFIGFAYWGDFLEFIKIVYGDSSEERVKLSFIDWGHRYTADFKRRDMFGENISTIVKTITSGAVNHIAYLHHMCCEIDKSKKIKEIILPCNMLTHIMAITLENDEKQYKKEKNEQMNELKKENEKQTNKIKEEKKSVDYYSLINKRWQSEEERQKERESWARIDGKS